MLFCAVVRGAKAWTAQTAEVGSLAGVVVCVRWSYDILRVYDRSTARAVRLCGVDGRASGVYLKTDRENKRYFFSQISVS